MRIAVDLALENVKQGGQPFGAVLVKDGKIISEGVNELHLYPDISAHAEISAIRKAQKQIGSTDLSGYTMYASGHPCPMCLTAMYFSGITDIYYCAGLDDCTDAGLGLSAEIYAELQRPKEERRLQMKHMPLEAGQEDPLKEWKDKQK